jgi:hypothetical protein
MLMRKNFFELLTLLRNGRSHFLKLYTIMDDSQDLYRVGDLVRIIYIGEGSAAFPWTETPVSGIYLGLTEFTHYGGAIPTQKDVCHKIWAMGKVRYIASGEEIELLASAPAA